MEASALLAVSDYFKLKTNRRKGELIWLNCPFDECRARLRRGTALFPGIGRVCRPKAVLEPYKF
jgi:hypothetical protein